MTREEAIKIIDCYDIGFYDLSGEKIPADKLADAFDMAIEALSADRPRGEWIGNNLDGTFKVWDCSECGIHMETRWNFCPNCGAKMDGERREE